ncbi:Hsp70 family protein [Actinomadura formosensis]|uniref:Hsp70 family protein n=1 Tax=Actinomadura formosensis TaxID=60706 RepID=UPI003D93BFA6
MIEPVLVVDLGTTTTSAILLTADDHRVLKDVTGLDWWPTAVCRAGGRWSVGDAAEARKLEYPFGYRARFKDHMGSGEPLLIDGEPHTPEALAAEVLRELRRAARESFAAGPRRLLITVPAAADEPWREATITAGHLAGFDEVELLTEPAAAAQSVFARVWPRDSHILVYDLGGGTFDVALVRFGDAGPEVVGWAGLPPGSGADQVDLVFAADLKIALDRWLAEHPELFVDEAFRADMLREHARKLKHDLTGSDVATTRVLAMPVHRVNRAMLAEAAEPLLAETVACCRDLLARHAMEPSKLKAVVLAGGGSKMPVVAPYLTEHLGVRPEPAPDGTSAVVEGAARWARGAAGRRISAAPPRGPVVPLRWSAPDGTTSAVLARWLVEPGDCFRAGDVLARIRLDTGALYDMTAPTAGRVTHRHLNERQELFDGDWALTSLRPARHADLGAPAELWRLEGLPATASALSPTGARVALAVRAAPSRTRLLIVDARDGAAIEETEVVGRVHALTWSPDGLNVAFSLSSNDQEVRLLALGGETRTQARTTGAVQDLAFTLDGSRLLAVCGKGTLYDIDLASGQTTETALMRHAASVAVHPSGAFCAVTGESRSTPGAGSLTMVSLSGVPVPDLSHVKSQVRGARFGRDGAGLAYASRGRVTFVDTATWNSRCWDSGLDDVVHAYQGELLAWTAAPDSVRIAGDDAPAGASGLTLPARKVVSLELAPDGRRLLIIHQASAALWRIAPEGLP